MIVGIRRNGAGLLPLALGAALFAAAAAPAPAWAQDKPPPLSPRAQAADANGNGVIDRDEAGGPLAANFDEMDCNKSNSLDGTEIRAFFTGAGCKSIAAASAGAAPTQAKPSPPPLSGRAKAADANGNGVIDRDEAGGPLAANFDEMDCDKSGSLDANEIRAFFTGAGCKSLAAAGKPAPAGASPNRRQPRPAPWRRSTPVGGDARRRDRRAARQDRPGHRTAGRAPVGRRGEPGARRGGRDAGRCRRPGRARPGDRRARRRTDEGRAGPVRRLRRALSRAGGGGGSRVQKETGRVQAARQPPEIRGVLAGPIRGPATRRPGAARRAGRPARTAAGSPGAATPGGDRPGGHRHQGAVPRRGDREAHRHRHLSQCRRARGEHPQRHRSRGRGGSALRSAERAFHRRPCRADAGRRFAPPGDGARRRPDRERPDPDPPRALYPRISARPGCGWPPTRALPC